MTKLCSFKGRKYKFEKVGTFFLDLKFIGIFMYSGPITRPLEFMKAI